MNQIDPSLLQSEPVESWLGQLVFAQTFGRFRSTMSSDYEDLERLVIQSRIGGLKLYHGYALGTAMLISHLRKSSPLPLLVAADLEQGLGQQIVDAPRSPAMCALGAADDDDLAYRTGRMVGQQALRLGINMPFTPLLDVPGPNETYFGVRCLSSSGRRTAALGGAFLQGLHSSGTQTVAKYFPGHGRQTILADGSAIVNVEKQLLEAESLPFRSAIRQGLDAMMVGPGAFPALDDTDWHSEARYTPAMLSNRICTELLRNQMGFQGVVISDALNLPFLRAHYSQREIAAQAVRAGCDVLMALSHPNDALTAIDGIRDALEWGWVTEESIRASFSRIMTLKARVSHLDFIGSRPLEEYTNAPGTDAELSLIEEIAKRSIQLIKGLPSGISPVPRTANLPFVSLGQHETIEKLRSDHWQPWHRTLVSPSVTFVHHAIDHFSDHLLGEVAASANEGWIVMVLLDTKPYFLHLLHQTVAWLKSSQIRIALILPIAYHQTQELSNCGDIVVWCADFYQPSRIAALNFVLGQLVVGGLGSS
jgi:beta-N-acetylhexosaminidase